MNDRPANFTPRTCLVLEGALDPGGAALLVDGAVREVAVLPPGARARGDLLRTAQRLLERHAVAADALDALVVDVGPGSFTGLRVALGIAQGFRLGCPGIALAGIDAPRVLAAAADAPLPVRVALAWGRLRVLLAEATPEGPPRAGAALLPRAEAARAVAAHSGPLVVGPGLEELELPHGTLRIATRRTPIEALADLVAGGAVVPQPDAPLPQPLYLVPPDAVLPTRRATIPAGIAVARLHQGDLEELVALNAEAFDRPWPPRLLEEELQLDPLRLPLGARDEQGRLVGAALARFEPDVLSIYIVAVAPAARRRGVGRALVRELIGRARDRGYGQIDLEVAAGNAPAIALYAAEGFVPVGRRRRYYPDGSDALLLSLMLRRS